MGTDRIASLRKIQMFQKWSNKYDTWINPSPFGVTNMLVNIKQQVLCKDEASVAYRFPNVEWCGNVIST